MKLKFRREDVLEKLKVNREEHIKIVQEAQKGYREKLRNILVDRLEKLDSGKKVEASIHLTIPDNNIDDFDRAIEMFKMTTDDFITLDENMFQSYIRNKWNWQRRFLASNSEYSGIAASKIDENL